MCVCLRRTPGRSAGWLAGWPTGGGSKEETTLPHRFRLRINDELAYKVTVMSGRMSLALGPGQLKTPPSSADTPV